MRQKTNKPLKWLKVIPSAVMVVIGIGAILYAYTQYSSISQVKDNKRKSVGKSRKPSKVIIVTKSVANKAAIDWVKLLQADTILIVPPNVPFFDTNTEREQLSDLHKIIRCDTVTGLWSCVRHLRKDKLLYIEEEISGGLPNDIHKYVPTLIGCKDAHHLSSEV